MNPAGFCNALGAMILLFGLVSTEVSRSAHASLTIIVLALLDLTRGFQSVDVAPLFPPLAPFHALGHVITQFSFPLWVGRLLGSWWAALYPLFGLGLPPTLPIVMGISCLSGCDRLH